MLRISAGSKIRRRKMCADHDYFKTEPEYGEEPDDDDPPYYNPAAFTSKIRTMLSDLIFAEN